MLAGVILQQHADDAEPRTVNVTKAQAPFQPGSTPLRGTKRYLCQYSSVGVRLPRLNDAFLCAAFNLIGAIDITDQETHHVVNVEFHDTASRRKFNFQDHLKFSMASLGQWEGR